MISSARSKILFLFICACLWAPLTAQAKKTIRVMTYNIHVGVGMDKKLDLQRIADVINRERPDLVGLQEVDRGVRRTEGKDEIVELAKMTRMEFAFAPNLDYQGGKYGVAILSRWPIKSTVHRMFENKRESERRGMLKVELEVDKKTVHFVTTHLDYQFEDGRLFETEQLIKFLDDTKGPLIVVADLNDVPDGSAYKLMRTTFNDAWLTSRAKADGFSYPADKPVKRIDHVMAIFDRIRRRVPARLLLVGDGPDRKSLTDLALQLGISERVHFHGQQNRDRIAQLLQETDVLVAPSVPTSDGRREGIGPGLPGPFNRC